MGGDKYSPDRWRPNELALIMSSSLKQDCQVLHRETQYKYFYNEL